MLERLPSELKWQILSHLCMQDKLMLGRAVKAYRLLLMGNHNLWHRMIIPPSKTGGFGQFPTFSLTRTLVLDGMHLSPAQLNHLLEPFVGLQELSLKYCFRFLDDLVKFFQSPLVLPNISKLQVLRVSCGNHMFDSPGQTCRLYRRLQELGAPANLLLDVADCYCCQAPVPETAAWIPWTLESVRLSCRECWLDKFSSTCPNFEILKNVLCLDCWKTGKRISCFFCAQPVPPVCRLCEDSLHCVICETDFPLTPDPNRHPPEYWFSLAVHKKKK